VRPAGSDRPRRAGTLAAVALSAAACLAVQGPALLRGEVAVLADPWAILPWAAQAPPARHPDLIPDSLRYSYAAWDLAHREAVEGRLPLWNPYIFSGHDHAASLQPAVFSPPVILLSLLPPGLGMTLHLVLHTLLLATGAALFLRHRSSSLVAAVTGGVGVALSGYLMAKFGQPTTVGTFAFLPWILLLQDRLVLRPAPRDAALLAAAIAASFLAGHGQIFVVVLLVAAVFGAATLLRRPPRRSQIARLGAALAGSILLSLALAAPQIAALAVAEPATRGVQQEERPKLARPRLAALWGVIVAEPFGSAADGSLRPPAPDGTGRLFLWHAGPMVYPGALALLLVPLAIADLFFRRVRGGGRAGPGARRAPVDGPGGTGGSPEREAGAAALPPPVGEALLLVLLGFGAVYLDPLHDFLRDAVPGFGFARMDRLLGMASFGLALLAAAGADATRRWPPRRLVVAAGMAVATIGVALVIFAATAEPPPAGRASAARTAWLLAAALLVLGLRARASLRRAAAWGLILLLAADILPLAWRYFPALPPAAILPHTASTLHLAGRLGDGRIVRLRTGALTPNTAQPLGLRDAQGFAPVYAEAYRRFYAFLEPEKGARFRIVRALAGEDALASPLLTFLGARYLIAEERVDHPDWEVDATLDGLHLLRSRRAGGRARVVHEWVAAATIEEAERLIAAPGFEPAQRVVLGPSAPAAPPPAAPGAAVSAAARITRDTPTEVEIDVRTEAPGMLVLADGYHAAWTASVNGKQVPVRRANLAFRAVEVPAGDSQVRFVYRPIAIQAGMAVAALAALLAVFLVVRRGAAAVEGARP
jgi:hypothetical protein